MGPRPFAPLSPPVPPVPPLPPAAVQPPRRGSRRSERTPFARAGSGMLLASAGVLALLVRAGWLDDQLDRVLAIALIVIGAGLIAGAWLGRPRGFVTVGVLIVCALSISSVVDVSFKGGVGERVDTPLTVQEAQKEHRLGIGSLRLDLSRVPVAEGRVDVTARLGLGELLVEVPAGIRVVVDGHTGIGELVLFGASSDGTDVNRTVTAPGSSEGSGTLHLDVRAGVGRVEVARVGQLVNREDRRALARPGSVGLVPSIVPALVPALVSAGAR